MMVSSMYNSDIDVGWGALIPFSAAAGAICVGRIRPRPTVVDGEVVIRNIGYYMVVALLSSAPPSTTLVLTLERR